MNAIVHFTCPHHGMLPSIAAECRVAAKEYLTVLFLDQQGDVAHLYQRTDSASSLVHLDLRSLVHEALIRQHERFILVHNHPSGDPTPSLADISATKRLCRIVSALGLELADHLILAPARCFSFRAAGLL